MRALTIGPDIAKILGAEQTAALINGPHPAEYRCTECRLMGLVADGEPLVGGLDVFTNAQEPTVRFWMAHARCSAGGIRTRDDQLVLPNQLAATGMCGVISHPHHGKVPFVLIEQVMSVVRSSPNGEGPIDVWQGKWTTKGLEPAAHMLTPAPYQSGWRVVLPRPRRQGGGVFGPEGIALLDPMCPVPQGWATEAARRGWTCGLYMGFRIGLSELSPKPPNVLYDAVNLAGREGRLIGITAKVVLR